jgi:hypothetical protein
MKTALNPKKLIASQVGCNDAASLISFKITRIMSCVRKNLAMKYRAAPTITIGSTLSKTSITYAAALVEIKSPLYKNKPRRQSRLPRRTDEPSGNEKSLPT